MQKRGRKSAAELAVVPNVVEAVPRPVAPDDLTDEQAVEWEAIVSSEAAEWIPRGAWGALAQYCRHKVAADRVAQLLEQSQDAGEYLELLKAQERETRALLSAATRLRLTPQSRYRPEQAGAKGGLGARRKPWEE